MSVHIHRNSFNAGELSPLMDAHTNVQPPLTINYLIRHR